MQSAELALTFSDKYCYNNGADRVRTGDLLLAKQVLSQLSYGPVSFLSEYYA